MAKYHQRLLSKKHTIKCPTCEQIYTARVHWTGNGMPRIKCRRCRLRVRDVGLQTGHTNEAMYEGRCLP